MNHLSGTNDKDVNCRKFNGMVEYFYFYNYEYLKKKHYVNFF